MSSASVVMSERLYMGSAITWMTTAALCSYLDDNGSYTSAQMLALCSQATCQPM